MRDLRIKRCPGYREVFRSKEVKKDDELSQFKEKPDNRRGDCDSDGAGHGRDDHTGSAFLKTGSERRTAAARAAADGETDEKIQ